MNLHDLDRPPTLFFELGQLMSSIDTRGQRWEAVLGPDATITNVTLYLRPTWTDAYVRYDIRETDLLRERVEGVFLETET